jgi:hypothetical protein
MRNKDGEIVDALLCRLKNSHGVAGRSRLEADGEEDHFLIGVRPRDFQAIHR